MTSGIRDKVAIIGMGCSKFGERFDCDAQDLMLEAFNEARADAGIETSEIDAAWLGHAMPDLGMGPTATPASVALRLQNIPVTRVENACATGTEALRGAVYAVASGAARIALAIGVEKLKDTGFGGLPEFDFGPRASLFAPSMSAPGGFAQLAAAYGAKHDVNASDLKRAMAHVSWKSHENGAVNPKAHLRRRVDMDTIMKAPMIAAPLGLFDCCGVSDGAACAIVTTPDVAAGLGKKQESVMVKALQLAVSNGLEASHSSWDGASIITTRIAAKRAYAEAGVENPREALSLIEVHDCFSITELVTMEDLFLSDEGSAVVDVLDGFYDREGGVPCQVDGGLKCFGHPIGASGLRMAYEVYMQLLGRAGERQLNSPTLGLTHNLGGFPHENVSGIGIFGLPGA